MITEDFCSVELFNLLREKGFEGEYQVPNSHSNKLLITHQMAMKWLREKHDWHISIGYYNDSSNDADGKIVETWWYWGYDIIGLPSGGFAVEDYNEYDTYEEAVEAALKYSLENLI